MEQTQASEVPRRRRGRPSKPVPEEKLASLLSWVEEGKTVKAWGNENNVSEYVIHVWRRKSPSFAERLATTHKTIRERRQMEKLISTTEKGQPVGQDHHKAKNTDREVEMARALHEGGMGYGKIAKLMECSKATVRDWVKGRRRGHGIVSWREVK